MNNYIKALGRVLVLVLAVAAYWFGGMRLAAQATILADAQLEGFRYTIYTANDDSAYIQVQFDLTSAAGINGYRRGATQVSSQYADSHRDQMILVDLTLYRPLSLQEFASLTSRYGLEPQDFAIRVLAGSERWTISGHARGGMIDPEAVQRQLTSIQAANKNARLLGVVYAHVSMPSNIYYDLAADPNVFLADAVQPYLTEQAVALKPSATGSVEYYCPNVYWAMENLGLVGK